MATIKLTEKRKELFEKHFIEPVKKLQKLGKIDDPVNSETNEHQRKYWLKLGRIDFDDRNSWNKIIAANGVAIKKCELTSYELVELYCYHYFQMHYRSSKLIFDNETETLLELCNLKSSVHFIDFGCGPMTSGIAFNHWLQDNVEEEKNIRYYGIDRSKNMCMKADLLLQVPFFAGEYSLRSVFGINDFDENFDGEDTGVKVGFYGQLDQNCAYDTEKGIRNRTVIINCCYLFASDSLVVDDLISTIMDNIIPRTSISTDGDPSETMSCKIYIIHQNPVPDYRNKKWNEFKERMTDFKSVENYPTKVDYGKVAVDILKNF